MNAWPSAEFVGTSACSYSAFSAHCAVAVADRKACGAAYDVQYWPLLCEVGVAEPSEAGLGVSHCLSCQLRLTSPGVTGTQAAAASEPGETPANNADTLSAKTRGKDQTAGEPGDSQARILKV